jgi:hypothetical protein
MNTQSRGFRGRSIGVDANGPRGSTSDRNFLYCATTRVRLLEISSAKSIRLVQQEQLSTASGVRVSPSPTPPQQPAPLVVRVDAAGVSMPANAALPANSWAPGSIVDCWPPEHTNGRSPFADKLAGNMQISAAHTICLWSLTGGLAPTGSARTAVQSHSGIFLNGPALGRATRRKPTSHPRACD